MRVVVESPLGAPDAAGIRDHFRFALWCCRALELAGHDPICSHVVKPWWLDDHVPDERERGIASEWFWQPDVEHLFFEDLGTSRGMALAIRRCERDGIPWDHDTLAARAFECWAAFKRGEWPPHTKGFEVIGCTCSPAQS